MRLGGQFGDWGPPMDKVYSIDLFRPDTIIRVSQQLFGMYTMYSLLVD